MNKKEMTKRLRHLEGENKNLGTEIKIALDILADLDEKPKLRHGDFGINDIGFPRLILLSKDEEMLDAGKLYCDAVDGGYAHPLPDPILGNIFDLLKEWSEPFEEWESKPAYEHAIQIIIETKFNGIFFGNSGNGATFNLENITEIWHKLGHAIAELKRKENKCS